jgi:hypothetical protein
MIFTRLKRLPRLLNNSGNLFNLAKIPVQTNSLFINNLIFCDCTDDEPVPAIVEALFNAVVVED